jgi:hypothetical protein
VTVGGNTDFNARSVSQTTSGSDFSITVNGNYQPTSEAITINGSGSLQDTSTTSTSPTVDGLAPPLNETATISTSQNEYGYTGGTEEFQNGTENELLVVGEGTQSATVDNTGGIDTVAEIYALIGTNLDNYMEYDVYIDGTYFDTITIYNANGGYETLYGSPISIGSSFNIEFQQVDADWDGADPQIDIAVHSNSEDPFYIRSPDPEPTINHADGTTTTTGDGTYSIGLALGSNSVSLSYDGGNASIDQISWTEDFRAQDPSVTIDGSTVSHSGPLANGETETGSINITGTDTYTASVSTNGEVTVDVDWTERNVVKDVDFTFNGVTESVTGPILNNEQSTLGFGVADIIDGDNSVDVSAGGNSNPDLQLTFLLNTEDAMALTDFEPNWDYDEKGDNVLLEYWFQPSNLVAPNEVSSGTSFDVTVDVENIGITTTQQNVTLTHVDDTQTVTKQLNSKERTTITFTTDINTTGDHTIAIETPQQTVSQIVSVS